MKIIVKVIYEFNNQNEADFFIDQCIEDGDKIEVNHEN
jgi:hypothetical protein